MTLTEEIAEIIGQKRLGGYSDMEAAEAVVEIVEQERTRIWNEAIEAAAEEYRLSSERFNMNIPMQFILALKKQPLPEPPVRKERDDD